MRIKEAAVPLQEGLPVTTLAVKKLHCRQHTVKKSRAQKTAIVPHALDKKAAGNHFPA